MTKRRNVVRVSELSGNIFDMSEKGKVKKNPGKKSITKTVKTVNSQSASVSKSLRRKGCRGVVISKSEAIVFAQDFVDFYMKSGNGVTVPPHADLYFDGMYISCTAGASN